MTMNGGRAGSRSMMGRRRTVGATSPPCLTTAPTSKLHAAMLRRGSRCPAASRPSTTQSTARAESAQPYVTVTIHARAPGPFHRLTTHSRTVLRARLHIPLATSQRNILGAHDPHPRPWPAGAASDLRVSARVRTAAAACTLQRPRSHLHSTAARARARARRRSRTHGPLRTLPQRIWPALATWPRAPRRRT
jgi:hypothetical protein